MSFFEVFIPSRDGAKPNVTLTVEAQNWIGALRTGLSNIGEGQEAIANVMCDIKEDNSIHVTDVTTKRVFRLREVGGPAPAQTSPAGDGRTKTAGPRPISIPSGAPVDEAPAAPAPAPKREKIDQDNPKTLLQFRAPTFAVPPASAPAAAPAPAPAVVAAPAPATVPAPAAPAVAAADSPTPTLPGPVPSRPPVASLTATQPVTLAGDTQPVPAPAPAVKAAPAAAEQPAKAAAPAPTPAPKAAPPAPAPAAKAAPAKAPEREKPAAKPTAEAAWPATKVTTQPNLSVGAPTPRGVPAPLPKRPSGQFQQAPAAQERRETQPVKNPEPIGRADLVTSEAAIEDAIAAVFDATSDLYADMALTPDKVAHTLLDIALSHIPAESGTFYLADVNGHAMTFAAVRGPKADALKRSGMTVKVGQGIIGFCAQEGICLAISDIQKDPRYLGSIAEAIGYSPQDTLCASAESEGRLFGALQLINSKRGFDATHMEVLRYIGLTAATILQRIETARG